MGKRRGQHSGQNHAEDQHGGKTHQAFLENLAGDPNKKEEARHSADVNEFGEPVLGRHRLQENREQHDEAERNSEAPKIDDLGG